MNTAFEVLSLTLAIGLPWATAVVALRLADIRSCAFSLKLLIVIGFFTALPLNGALGWIWLHTNLSATLLLVMLAIVGITLAGMVLFARKAQVRVRRASPGTAIFCPGSTLLLGLVFAHLAVIGWFNLKFGFIAWDAWDTWMLSAKTWFHAEEMTPLVGFGEWAKASDLSAYALHHPQVHWPTLSLATVWHAAVVGAWSEEVLTVPWWIAYCVLTLGVFGFLRSVGCKGLLAAAGAMLMATLPFAGFHGMLAGYADIWVAGLLFCVVAYLLLVERPDLTRSTATTAIVLFAALASIKMTALFWVVIVLAVYWVIRVVEAKYRIAKGILYSLGALALVIVIGVIISIADNTVAEKATNLRVIGGEIFSGWNWLMAWWWFWGAFLVSIFLPYRRDREMLLILGGASMVLLVTIFVNEFPVKSHEIIATSNRLFLHLMPIVVAAVILVFRDLLESASSSR
jgi:hypothetical protein